MLYYFLDNYSIETVWLQKGKYMVYTFLYENSQLNQTSNYLLRLSIMRMGVIKIGNIVFDC